MRLINKQPVPTALETENCPPHHYDLDSEEKGPCRKCGAFKDFRKLQRRVGKSVHLLAKASKGGKKNKAVTK